MKENLLNSSSSITSGDPQSPFKVKQLVNETCEDQKLKASKWLHKDLKVGDKWYLINSDWYTRWANHVGIQLPNDNASLHTSNQGQTAKQSSYSPDKINNKTLLNSDNQLKTQLTEEVDYYMICEELWNYLVSVYSTTSPEVIIYPLK